MPGAGTHTTIIQRLALLAQAGNDPSLRKLLTDPGLNADWSTYVTPDALQSRYAVLGAMGPDIFYMMLDYGSGVQDLEDVVLKVAGTFRAAGQLSGEINSLISAGLDALTLGVWQDIQEVFANLKGIMVSGLLDLVIDKHNFWHFFLPLRQVDDYRKNWYWADFLHYVKTGCFTQKLLAEAAAQQAAAPNSATAKCLGAYALGYLTHYVADTVGHAYVNRIVESPWRNMWQRHHLVENFIDAYVWAAWHDAGGDPASPADEKNLDQVIQEPADPLRTGAARLSYARLNDLCNVGSPGVDPIIDNAVNTISDLIQKGLFDIGASSVQSLQAPDDPVFITWTEFIHDVMFETYSTTEHPSRMGRCPTPDDVAGAYSAYRLVLSLATEDEVRKPEPPDILGDLAGILKQMWKDITKDLSSVPPPPVPASGGSFSLAALWDSLKAGLEWLGQVAEAALKVLGDLIAGLIEAGAAAGADTIKAGLYLINTILYSLYHSLRMVLVMSAYSAPFTEDLMATWGPLDLSTLWNASAQEGNPRYPIEPVVSERDFGVNPAHPFSPYRPYFQPSGMAPVNVELPATVFPSQLLSWTSPADMLDSPVAGTHDMFTADGPAPAATMPLTNPPDGSKLTDLETFDGSQRYFGSIMANCQQALAFAVPYLAGTPYPAGVVLPDYNLDSDRGYAWPCWDVDWAYPSPMAGFGWNGCDPFPSDTLARVADGSLPWGDTKPNQAQVPPGLRPGLSVNDPWGSPRSGDAWVNATALGTPGACDYATFPFPSIVVNPNRAALAQLDRCPPAQAGAPLLGPDYRFAPQAFLRSNANDKKNAPQDDLVQVHEHFPYSGPNATPTVTENDGRLADFLRAAARTADAKLILANAVSLWLGGGTTPLPWVNNTTIDSPGSLPHGPDLGAVLAQLAVTGRQALRSFEAWTPQNNDLAGEYTARFPNSGFTDAQIQPAVGGVLDVAYETLWGIRSNDPAWRLWRAGQLWFAVSGFDDTPHRPVNVPTAPYPQHDIDFAVQIPVPGPNSDGMLPVTTRFMVASAGTFVGPSDPRMSSFGNPDPGLLQAPPGQGVGATPPRSLPVDTPVIPAGNKIIIYIHGGGSRAEEAVDMANWFIIEGHALGEEYTVISFDLPNSAYGGKGPLNRAPGGRFEVTDVTATPYDHHRLDVLQFELRYIIGFIEALDQKIGNVANRIAAVIGGSLGGNTSLLLTNYYDQAHPYLKTIVSWSVTAAAPSRYLKLIPAADVAAYLAHLQSDAVKDEPIDDHAIEAQYLSDMYVKPLAPYWPVFYVPPQPVMWYRGGYGADGSGGWQPCKDQNIARSRFDRYEIYSPSERRWITAIDLEQISFSFQDNDPMLGVASAADSNLLLVAGDNDNFFPNAIYNSTIDLARAIRMSTRGKAEFWLDTGHSIHNERPRLFAKDILYFLANLEAGDSPYGTVIGTPPKAVYSEEDK